MKYVFEKVDEDTTKLKYGEKEFTITKDVKLIHDMQDINAKARKKMVFDLAKEGLTMKDLTVETKKGDKTFYDNSNINELEQIYIQEQTMDMFGKITERFTGMELAQLIIDIGLEEEKEVSNFAKEFTEAIIGKGTPREK